MIPRDAASMLFALILSGLMSLLVSGVATFRAAGTTPEFPALWLQSWLGSWLVAFPAALVIAPLARAAVDRLTVPGPSDRN